MSSIDYMKVLDIMALSLGMGRDIKVESSYEKLEKFDAIMTTIDGAEVAIKVHLSEYFLELTVPRALIPDSKLEKWISTFEYELEQTFFVNIKFEVDKGVVAYKMNIAFG